MTYECWLLESQYETRSFLWSGSPVVHNFYKDTISGRSNWGQTFLLVSNCLNLTKQPSFCVPPLTYLQRQSDKDSYPTECFTDYITQSTQGARENVWYSVVPSLLTCFISLSGHLTFISLNRIINLKKLALMEHGETSKCLQDWETLAGQSIKSRVSNWHFQKNIYAQTQNYKLRLKNLWEGE